MKDKLKEIAEAQDFIFSYGRSDFNNLYDEKDDSKVLMFVDPLESDDVINDYGVTESINWTVKLMLTMSSNFNEEGYEERYEKYIKPITATAYKELKNSLRCGGLVISRSRAVEVINSFDFNCDGLAITMTVNQEVNE